MITLYMLRQRVPSGARPILIGHSTFKRNKEDMTHILRVGGDTGNFIPLNIFVLIINLLRERFQ